ncbi:MAG: XylR family transcriptional regulator [Planctomycetia bacterium]|nr:XylR family transcriptional regulator [Planctomycetia bacterium]
MNQQLEIPRVALLVETSEERGRGILRGILRYSRLYGPWGFYILPRDAEHQNLPLAFPWSTSGIIARVFSTQLAESIQKANIPTILLGHRQELPFDENAKNKFANICMDNRSLGRMAAEFFVQRNFKNFACIERGFYVWSQERREAFLDYLRDAGFQCFVYRSKISETVQNLGQEVYQWLESLPKPLGLFTVTDLLGRQVIDLCLNTQIRIPEDVAVLGIDNDELICESTTPALSSISVDAEEAGFHAAALLHQLMKKEKKEAPRTIPLNPVRVVERRSTETNHLSDEMVSNVFEFIRCNFSSPINVQDVVRHLKVSRRSIEIRFKKSTGETIHSTIMKIRLERVKRFLIETDFSLNDIALSCGFNCDGYLGKIFKKNFNVTMDEFRKQYRHSFMNDICKFE